jgi:hypothetical protein
MIRITHKPTLLRKLPTYIKEVHPIAFAIYYSAINSLPPTVVENRFGESRDELLTRFELGVEIGLARGNYLTTQSMEVLQAFIIWLTCITKEEEMGKSPKLFRSTTDTLRRKSMGAAGRCNQNSSQSRPPPRPISLPFRLMGCNHHRDPPKNLAPNLPSRVPSRRVQGPGTQHFRR